MYPCSRLEEQERRSSSVLATVTFPWLSRTPRVRASTVWHWSDWDCLTPEVWSWFTDWFSVLDKSNKGGVCEVSLHTVSSSACWRATEERARSFVWSSTTWTKAELQDRINYFDFSNGTFQKIKLIIISTVTGDNRSKFLIGKTTKAGLQWEAFIQWKKITYLFLEAVNLKLTCYLQLSFNCLIFPF